MAGVSASVTSQSAQELAAASEPESVDRLTWKSETTARGVWRGESDRDDGVGNSNERWMLDPRTWLFDPGPTGGIDAVKERPGRSGGMILILLAAETESRCLEGHGPRSRVCARRRTQPDN